MPKFIIELNRPDEDDNNPAQITKELQEACDHGFLSGFFNVSLVEGPPPETIPTEFKSLREYTNVMRKLARRSITFLEALGVPSNAAVYKEWNAILSMGLKIKNVDVSDFERLDELLDELYSEAHDIVSGAESLEKHGKEFMRILKESVAKESK